MKALTQTVVALAAAGLIGSVASGVAAEPMDHMDSHDHHMNMPMPANVPGTMDHMDHAQHHHMTMQMPVGTTRSVADYAIPAVKLVREDGKTVSLRDEVNDGRPVVLTFIFTTCTEICPLVTHTLSQLQTKLGAARDKVHLVSISIDPEEDTPARLAAYAKKYGAGPEWHHYTGTLAASVTAQRAFDAYRGDKMNHTPVTFIRSAPGKPWVRIDGFATADELMAELKTVLASND